MAEPLTDADLVALKAQLTRHEGRSLRLYKCPAGKQTIGVGQSAQIKR